nr:hypothetical protein [Micromonospora sp. DSM 115978]
MSSTKRWRALSTLGVSIVVGAVLVAPQPASADSEHGRVSGKTLEFAKTTDTHAVADAVSALGRTSYRDVFSGVRVDEANDRVTVYATDAKRASTMVSDGLAKVSAEDRAATDVRVENSRYSRVEMEKAAERIWAAERHQSAAGIDVHSIVLRGDGGGLEVRTNAPEQAPVLSRSLAGESALAVADVTYVAGSPVRPVTRENPSPPYPGGIPIRWDWYLSGWDCTAAFGVRNSSGTEYLMTAEHCYDVGDGIEDMDGGGVGTVQTENNPYDAALIQTDSQSGVWVNDDYMFNVRSQQFSYNGEWACQSGYTSYPNRCQIQVTNDYIQYDFDDGKGVRIGVEGRQCAGCPAVAHGDSGGPVWSIRSSDGYVAARGIVSGGHTPVVPNRSYEYILWTEVPFAVSALGVSIQTS